MPIASQRDKIEAAVTRIDRHHNNFRGTKPPDSTKKECSALAACAAMRGATWGMILYTADSLADVEKYDERSRGGNAYEYALTLCLDSVGKL